MSARNRNHPIRSGHRHTCSSSSSPCASPTRPPTRHIYFFFEHKFSNILFVVTPHSTYAGGWFSKISAPAAPHA